MYLKYLGHMHVASNYDYITVTNDKPGPVPVAAPSKTVCGRSLAGNVGSKTARDVDVCLLLVLCVVRDISLSLAARPYRGFLLSASVIVKPRY